MKAITVSEAKLLDKKAREVYGLSTLILMENAGRGVAEEIIKLKKRKIAIFCGKGNNGGDGFVAARHLCAKGIRSDVFLTGKMSDVKGEAGINLDILLKLKHRILEINEKNVDLLKKNIRRYDLIVDAIFGVGFRGSAVGVFKDLIELINSSGAYIVSIDIPSGLNPDTVNTLGACVRADTTVTFIAAKRPMVEGNGPEYCGEIIVSDLGFP
jgi:NAD(P)H-hydrate epimerase